MYKRNERGNRREVFTVDMQRLLTHAVTDAEPWIGRDLAVRLLGVLQLDPAQFRLTLDGALQNAFSGIAAGGAELYIALRQLQALLKKCPEWNAKSPAERRNAAYAKFLHSEELCKISNKRLRWYRKHWSRESIHGKVVNTASLLVQQMLGPLGPDERMEILNSATFGSGATFLHSRDRSSVYYKLSENHCITEEAMPLLREWMALSPRIHSVIKDSKLEVVRGNRLSFVNKDWDIDRLIAIEPSWNVFLQLGINGYLKRRLKYFGVHLDDQSRGWGWAREGSISGAYATVDLVSASDLIGIGVVERLCPREWLVFLDSLRSKEYFYEGEWHRYHKFSSMGNGFTFPLETVIFIALARATARVFGTGEEGITVYGDDIIVPQDTYANLLQVLRYCGFKANNSKSYCYGPFRETCGRDYLQGMNVRPVYLRKVPTCDEDIYSIYNRLLTLSIMPMPNTLNYLRSAAKRNLSGPAYLPPSKEVWTAVEINTALHLRSWDGYTPGVEFESYFFSDPPERKPLYNKAIQNWVYTFQASIKRYKKDPHATDETFRYLLFLLGVKGGEVLSTRRVKKLVVSKEISNWPNIRDSRRKGLASVQAIRT